jgi:hypothetical protein
MATNIRPNVENVDYLKLAKTIKYFDEITFAHREILEFDST